jgi:large subunit ribosomal protein L1
MSKTKIKDMSEDLVATPEVETEATQAEEAATEVLETQNTEEIVQAEIAEDEKEEKPAEKKSGEAGKKAAPKARKPKRGHKERSKKYQAKAEEVEKGKLYSLNEAVEAAKAASFSKFDGTFEIHIKTNVKTLRGLITLPHSSGKKLTILAFGKDADQSGADIVGTDETIAAIQKGKLGFDVVLSTPEWMPKLAKVAAILGPRSLMPNPKNGSITTDLKKAVSELQGGKTEYKLERGGQGVHLGVGKVSQPTEEIAQNIKILLTTIGKSRIKKVTLAPTMGPGVKLNLSSI